MRWWGSLFALLFLATLLLALLPVPSQADGVISLEFPSSIESRSDCIYRANLTNEGDVDIIVLEVVADVQGGDWQFPFGSDIIHLFNGSRTVPSGGSTSFEKEQFGWGVIGAFEVVVTVKYMEAGGTEEIVVNQTFPTTFYTEYDETFEEREEPNLLAIFFTLLISSGAR